MILKKRFIIGLVLFAVLLFLFFLQARRFLTLEQIQEYRFYLQQVVEQNYFLSVGIYLLIFVFAIVFGIPITVLLTIAAGYFFGVFWGALYANIGATVGAVVSFITFRYFLGSFIQERYAAQLQLFNKNIKAYGHNYLLSMQFLPFTPTLLINIFAGMTKIRLWTFIWTTSLGILPGSLLYTISGRYLADIQIVGELLSVRSIVLLIFLAIISFFPVIFKSWRSKRS